MTKSKTIIIETETSMSNKDMKTLLNHTFSTQEFAEMTVKQMTVQVVDATKKATPKAKPKAKAKKVKK